MPQHAPATTPNLGEAILDALFFSVGDGDDSLESVLLRTYIDPSEPFPTTVLANWVNPVWNTLEPLGVLDGLSERQRREFAALILNLSSKYRFWDSTFRPFKEQRKALAKRGSALIGKLARKAKKAQEALEHVLDCLREMGIEYRQYSVEPHQYLLDDLIELSANLDQKAVQTAGEKLIASSKQFLEITALVDPSSAVTKRLFDFLQSCGIGRNEATVRTARVGNAMWHWDIAEQDAPSSATPNRSDAIRKRLKRQQLPRDTSPKSR